MQRITARHLLDKEEATCSALVMWRRFFKALDEYAQNGRHLRFWWRDDDATEACLALDRILDLSERFWIPLAIAVVPAKSKKTLRKICDYPQVSVAQHGFTHVNHAAAHCKKSEFCFDRDAAAVAADLFNGRERLAQLLGHEATLFVPPWNRIADRWLPVLPTLRFYRISTFSPRCRMPQVSNLGRLNTHVDLIDWHHGRGFIGTQNALDRILEMLAHISDNEPLGILTHHGVHGKAVNTFLCTLFQWLRAYSEVKWVAIHDASLAANSDFYCP